MTTYKVQTSNPAFFQIFLVEAASEAEAKQVAERESNSPQVLKDEAMAAAQAGEKAPGRYTTHRIDESTDSVGSTKGWRFVDAGSNG